MSETGKGEIVECPYCEVELVVEDFSFEKENEIVKFLYCPKCEARFGVRYVAVDWSRLGD